MIMRFSLSAALIAVLATSACAREADSDESPAGAASGSGDAGIERLVQDVAPEGGAAAAGFEFPDDAWRAVDPENALYIETDHGMIVLEMSPEFAPAHVDRMRTLARQNFYDFLVWHRVIDGFMAQGGGSRANPGHRTDLPPLEAEFTVRRGAELTVSELQDRVINPRSVPQTAKAGFWNGFHVGTQTIALAGLSVDGQVQSWLLHCEGAASAARTNDPNSAASQFYITRAHADHLNSIYTSWGRVRHGQDAVQAIRVGTLNQDVGFSPDVIRSIRVGSDLPEEERMNIQVADTDHAAFAGYLDTLRDASGALPDVCEINVPTRVVD